MLNPILKKLRVLVTPLIVLLLAILSACGLGFIIAPLFGDASLYKLLNKITLVLLMLSLFPAMHALKATPAALGFASRAVIAKQIRLGFTFGVVSLTPVMLVLYGLGVSVIDTSQPWTLSWLGEKAAAAFGSGLLIACLEEPLFRGVLLLSLMRQWSKTTAIVVSAMYYAGLHFLTTKTHIPASDMTWTHALQLMTEAWLNLINPDVSTALLALFVVGIALAVIRTSGPYHLGISIGCHAGWVFMIKLNKAFCNTDFQSNYAFLVNSYDGVIGWLVAIWLMLGLGIYLYRKRLPT